MTPDTAQGIAAELSFVLSEGWSYSEEPDHFRVWPPAGSQGTEDIGELLRSEVWRIAHFVAYRDFVSIERWPDGSYSVTSRSRSGARFEIVFEPAAKG